MKVINCAFVGYTNKLKTKIKKFMSTLTQADTEILKFDTS